tara:strand:- start:28 stop:429 length:402 start_codon:yes stop_codon:yes gene_type:complete
MENKSKKILSEISAGELLDKISILEIKLEKINNIEAKAQIQKEYDTLKHTLNSSIKLDEKIKDLFNSLKETNIKLWNIEDSIRLCEKNKDFSDKFVKLARDVYLNNDERSKIKSDINKLLKSNIVEVKQYVNY